MSITLQEQYDKVYRYCYFKVRSSQLAEDLTQETFLKYFSQTAYINRGKPLAYLYTIARNLCIDAYRQAKPLASLEDGEQAIEDTFDGLEAAVAVREAVKTLPCDLQEIILLRYANELSMAEISEITGLSRFSVRRKISKALNCLKLILRKEDFA